MSNHNIDSNPEAMRSIASSVITYTTLQHQIIRTYLQEMASLAGDIQSNGYNILLEAISEWVKRMDELKSEGEEFAAFLNHKADILEERQNKNDGV